VDDEDNTDFEDFLNFLSTVVPPEGLGLLDQEMVIRHAEFIVNQVVPNRPDFGIFLYL
jgi:hypothetical protein